MPPELLPLKLPQKTNSLARSAKSTPSPPYLATLGLAGKSQIQNLKLQINLKSQNIQISNGLIGSSSFGILNLGIWCLFGTWKLRFGNSSISNAMRYGGSDSLSAYGFRSISTPFRDAFHLSLTVLVHYRSHTILSLGSLVLPASDGVSPAPPYLRINAEKTVGFRVRGHHPLRPLFPETFR